MFGDGGEQNPNITEAGTSRGAVQVAFTWHGSACTYDKDKLQVYVHYVELQVYFVRVFVFQHCCCSYLPLVPVQ